VQLTITEFVRPTFDRITFPPLKPVLPAPLLPFWTRVLLPAPLPTPSPATSGDSGNSVFSTPDPAPALAPAPAPSPSVSCGVSTLSFFGSCNLFFVFVNLYSHRFTFRNIFAPSSSKSLRLEITTLPLLSKSSSVSVVSVVSVGSFLPLASDPTSAFRHNLHPEKQVPLLFRQNFCPWLCSKLAAFVFVATNRFRRISALRHA
jgi:hypothetical protein